MARAFWEASGRAEFIRSRERLFTPGLILGGSLVVGAFVFLATPAGADVRTFTLQLDESLMNDTYIAERNNGTSFGDDLALFVNATSTSDLNRARLFLQFNVSTLPKNATALSASIRLSFALSEASPPPPNQIYDKTVARTLEIREAAERWWESNVSWDRRPAMALTANDSSGVGGLTTETIVFEVFTSARRLYLNSSSHFGWIVKDVDEDTDAGTFHQRFRSAADPEPGKRPSILYTLELNDPKVHGLLFNDKPQIVVNSQRAVNITAYVADQAGEAAGEVIRVTLNATNAQGQLALSEDITRNREFNNTFRSNAYFRAGPLNLAEGNYTFNVTAVDSDRNSNVTAHMAVNVTIENVLPRILLAAATPNATVQRDPVNLTVNATDLHGIAAVRANVTLPNGSNYANVSLTAAATDEDGNGDYYFVIANLTAPGNYSIVFFVEDVAGNVNSTARNLSIRDVTAPIVANPRVVTTATEGGLPAQETGGAVNLTVVATDDSTIAVVAVVTLPTGASTAIPLVRAGDSYFALSYFNATTGVHSVVFNATDAANNSASSVSVPFRMVAAEPPRISNPSPAPDGFGPSEPTIQVEVRDVNLVAERIRMFLSTDGEELREVNATKGERTGFLLVFLSGDRFFHESRIRVRVEARDGLNLYSELDWNFTIDGRAPESETAVSDALRLSASRLAVRSGAVVTMTGADDESGLLQLLLALDRPPQQAVPFAYTAPVAISGFPTYSGSGNYTLRTFARDRAGNDEPMHSLSLIVDDDPPEILVTRDSNRILVRATDAGTGVTEVNLYLRVGGASFQPIRLAASVSDSALFVYEPSVYAKGTRVEYFAEAFDLLANRNANGSQAAPHSYVETNHAPEIEILSPAQGAIVAGVVEIAWRAQDRDGDLTSVQVETRPIVRETFTPIARGANATGRTSWDTRTLQDGRYVLRATVRDATDVTQLEIPVRVNNTGERFVVVVPSGLESDVPFRLRVTILEPTASVRAVIRSGGTIVAAPALSDDATGGDETRRDGTWTTILLFPRDGAYRASVEVTLSDGTILVKEVPLTVSTSFLTTLSRNFALYLLIAGIAAAVAFAVFATLRYRGRI